MYILYHRSEPLSTPIVSHCFHYIIKTLYHWSTESLYQVIRSLSSPKYTKPHTFIVWGEVFQDFYALQRLLWFSPSWHIYQTKCFSVTSLTIYPYIRLVPFQCISLGIIAADTPMSHTGWAHHGFNSHRVNLLSLFRTLLVYLQHY